MNEGLKSSELEFFLESLIIANKLQLTKMQEAINNELKKREK